MIKVFKQITDQKLQLTTSFSRCIRCHFSQPSRRTQKKIFINTKDFYKQWFHHKQTLNTVEHSIFAQEFEFLHYSDFVCFNVGRKKMVGAKKVYKWWKRSVKGFLSFSLFFLMLSSIPPRIKKFECLIFRWNDNFYDYFADQNYTR